MRFDLKIELLWSAKFYIVYIPDQKQSLLNRIKILLEIVMNCYYDFLSRCLLSQRRVVDFHSGLYQNLNFSA